MFSQFWQSTILRSTGQTENIRSAYLFCYATEAAFATGCSGTPEKGQDQLTVRLCELVHDALITAKNAGFHVFNALTLMDNPLFLKDLVYESALGITVPRPNWGLAFSNAA
jgi:glycylpeptide N-tetradecanoyltransferase